MDDGKMMRIAATLFGLISVSSLTHEKQPLILEQNAKLEPGLNPINQHVAWQEAEEMNLMVLSIAMPNAVPKVHQFLKTIGLEEVGQISPGVNRSNLDLEQLLKDGRVDPNYQISGESDYFDLSELATTYAHHRAIRTFLKSNRTYALIFEEDAVMVKNGKYLLTQIPGGEEGHFVKALNTIANTAPEGWMEINLGRCNAECHKQKRAATISDKVFMYSARFSSCSSGYLLSRRGAEFLNKTYFGKIAASNNMMKIQLYEEGKYKQYGISPRLIEQKDLCGVNGCVKNPECGPIGTMDQSKCVFYQICELSAKCQTVDVSSPKVPDDFTFADYPEEKLKKLESMREQLKKKHLRIRSPYLFLSGCGFFTFPLIVMSQLQLARRLDLIGSKAPFVYMPEVSHFHSCVKNLSQVMDETASPDFWEKWFEPVGPIAWWEVKNEDVWELSQDSIITAYYDKSSIHAYPYDDESTADTRWIYEHRRNAIPLMKEYIKPRKMFMDNAVEFYNTKLGNASKPVLGLHMRGTDKFVHEKVDPQRYVIRAKNFLHEHTDGKLFLATDDEEYLTMMNNIFGNKLVVMPVMRSEKNVLYGDKLSKHLKCKEVLVDALTLSLTSEIVKCWSSVSEFAVYLRDSHINDRPSFTRVVDLEATDTPVVTLIAEPEIPESLVDNFIPGPEPDIARWAIFVPTLENRVKHMSEMLLKTRLKSYATLIPATTPETFSDDLMHENATLSTLEASCVWSHHKAYQALLDSDKEYGLVFEDDIGPTLQSARIETGLPNLIETLIAEKESGRADWDLLNLGRCYDCCNPHCQKTVSTLEDEKLQIVQSPHPYCGSAYLMNRKAAKALAEGSYPIVRETDDNMLYLGLSGKFNYMSVTPRLFSQTARNTYGSMLHMAPMDVECPPCFADQCYRKESMPEGLDNIVVKHFTAEEEEIGSTTLVLESTTYLPKQLDSRKVITDAQLSNIYSEIDHLTSEDCDIGRTMAPSLVEWGFGSTANSVVKPYMHALTYGYCLQNPTGFVKYNCSGWETLFEPLSTPSAEKNTCAKKHVVLDDFTRCNEAFSNDMEYSPDGMPLYFYAKLYGMCSEMYSFNLHGSDVLPPSHKEIGFFPSVSLILQHALRPSKSLMKKIDEAKKSMNWPEEDTAMIGLHFRAGDACLESESALGRQCDTLDTYMEKVNLIAGKYGIKHIYIATDSMAALNELSRFENYTFHYSSSIGRGGKRNNKSIDYLLYNKEIDGCKEAENTMIDLHLLAATDAFVGKFSSNIDRAAYNLMFARKLSYPPYISLDNHWCFDYGIKSRPDALHPDKKELFYC